VRAPIDIPASKDKSTSIRELVLVADSESVGAKYCDSRHASASPNPEQTRFIGAILFHRTMVSALDITSTTATEFGTATFDVRVSIAANLNARRRRRRSLSSSPQTVLRRGTRGPSS
jgi:hypothetical protein